MLFDLDTTHLPYIRVYGKEPHRPFTWLTIFAKKNQEISRFGFKESYQTISRYLDEQDVNYGILMMSDGIHIFTESKLKFDSMIVKMTTGLNLINQNPFQLSNWMKRNNVVGFDHLLREK